MDPKDIVASALKAGEQTTEYEFAESGSLWGKILIIAGVVSTIIPGIIEALKEASVQVPALASSQAMTITLVVLGIVSAICGAIIKAVTSNAYINGRNSLKVAALELAKNDKKAV